jgi:hypothetical protein
LFILAIGLDSVICSSDCDIVFRRLQLLSNLTFESGSQHVSLGNAAFEGCSSLQSIGIPSSIETIPECCFRWCRPLSNMVFESGSENGVFITSIALSSILGLCETEIEFQEQRKRENQSFSYRQFARPGPGPTERDLHGRQLELPREPSSESFIRAEGDLHPTLFAPPKAAAPVARPPNPVPISPILFPKSDFSAQFEFTSLAFRPRNCCICLGGTGPREPYVSVFEHKSVNPEFFCDVQKKIPFGKADMISEV